MCYKDWGSRGLCEKEAYQSKKSILTTDINWKPIIPYTEGEDASSCSSEEEDDEYNEDIRR
jgi:hypothetical protein